MKILLLTDIPPCEDYTAGLVLSAMCRFIPKGELCCFSVVNTTIPVRIAPEFSGVPVEFHNKPNENWTWVPRPPALGRLGGLGVHLGERITDQTAVRRLIARAIEFGREQGVDRVWAVLQGQTMIRMAAPVAEGLGVPLHTHIWDPFSWWAKANKLDGRTTRAVQHTFDQAIRSSRTVATASQPMADMYQERFGVTALPVIASHSDSLAKTPEPHLASDGRLLIGMAGQFYSATEWLALLEAMHAANWRVCGRDVHIVVMGPQVPPHLDERHITFLGWKSQAQAAEILAACDILYCPYPFDPGMKEVSRFSFPSKLVLYLAAGRPIAFHGPDYSAPAAYVQNRACGALATQPYASSIYNAIERLVSSPAAYEAAAQGAQRAFREDFTLQSMQKAVAQFLEFTVPTDRVQLHAHGLADGERPFPDRPSERKRKRSPAMIALQLGRRLRSFVRAARGRLLRLLTNLALKHPRLRELKGEVHTLYAENASLKRQLEDARQLLSRYGHAQDPDTSTGGIDPVTSGVEQVKVLDPHTGKDGRSTQEAYWRAYGGHRVLVHGASDYVGRLPLLERFVANSKLGGNDDMWLLLQDGAGDVTVTALTVSDDGAQPEGGRQTLLRTALTNRCDEIVVACAASRDAVALNAVAVGALLKRPVQIAAQAHEGVATANNQAERVTFAQLPMHAHVA